MFKSGEKPLLGMGAGFKGFFNPVHYFIGTTDLNNPYNDTQTIIIKRDYLV